MMNRYARTITSSICMLALTLGLATTVIGSASAAEERSEWTGTSSISGTIDVPKGKDLSGIEVCAVRADDFAPCTTPVRNGIYRLKDLPPGNYTVVFSGFGFARQWWDGSLTGTWQRETSKPIRLGSGETVVGIDAKLEYEALFYGTVEPPDGVDPADVQIVLYDPSDGPWVADSTPGYYSFVEADGSFEIRNIAAGTYVMVFYAAPWASSKLPTQWSDGWYATTLIEGDAKQMAVSPLMATPMEVHLQAGADRNFDGLPDAVITGAPAIGRTLTATKAGVKDFSPAADSVSYQWSRDGIPIAGAMKSTYKIVAEDQGTHIGVRVVGVKAGYRPAARYAWSKFIPFVERLSGSTRYATNLVVNQRVGVKDSAVFVATGTSFADALSIGPVVRMTSGTLFLTPRGSLPADSLSQIKALSPSKVYIIGGTSAVSQNVESQLKNATNTTPERISGSSRYATSEAILTEFFVSAEERTDFAFIATGRAFPDALSAAAAGAALRAPVLLVDGKKDSKLENKTVQGLQDVGVTHLLIAGGTGAVNRDLEQNLRRYFQASRLSGKSRYDTNAAINNFLDDYVSTNLIGTETTSIWLATRKRFPDALSAGAPAGALDSRLVLSDGKCIPKLVVSQTIAGDGSWVRDVYLVGGKGVLSSAVMDLTECN